VDVILSISGVKRKTTAAESTQKYFQTMYLIISHLKREADKQKIFELIGIKNKLHNVLIAAAAIHAYHNLGIRIQDSSNLAQISVESTYKIEKMEKDTLFKEIKSFVKDSFDYEIKLNNEKLNLRKNIISYLLNCNKLAGFQKKQEEQKIKQEMENFLMLLIQNYPEYHFYDFIGDLLGFTQQIKGDIIEEGSELKSISIEIEKELALKEKEDKYIELSLISRLEETLKKKFEFKSFKDLQMQTMSIRMILRKALEFNFDTFPISKRALNLFLNANQTKQELVNKIENGLQQEKNYEDFEKEIIGFIFNDLAQINSKNVNDFVYYFQCLMNYSFSDTIFILNKFGVFNLNHLNKISIEVVENVIETMKNFNIDKSDINKLRDPQKNPIIMAKLFYNHLKETHPQGLTALKNGNELKYMDLMELFSDDKNQKIIERICNGIGTSPKELKTYNLKHQIINNRIIKKYNLQNYSQLLKILEYKEILLNLAKEIYFNIFSEIIRHLGRILEAYIKISDDKSLFLKGLERIFGTTSTEGWVSVKIEELMIERMLRRQKELSKIFNAQNNPFLVNGFILARLTDKSLKEGINELKTEVSPIFEDFVSLTLKEEYISPVSYVIAYDLIQRLKTYEQLRKLRVEEIYEKKKQKEEEKKKEIREKQEISTLNWIERKITSSLMRITSPGINPNQLYWNEKDTKTAAENLKLHSELKGDPIELFSQYYYFALQKIKERWDPIRIPAYEDIKEIVIKIATPILQTRLNREPTSKDFKVMIEGERWGVASNISKKIGKFLDKALYEKFKTHRKK